MGGIRPTMTESNRIRDVYNYYQHDPSWSRKWSLLNHGNRAILAERSNAIRWALETGGFFPLKARRVLDVGCGSGDLLGELHSIGAPCQNLFGVDLLPD
jgi:2-polyprenyl-3-methyl-5-hydroxy-6-metoxy-1,4-benzoquinol methylase